MYIDNVDNVKIKFLFTVGKVKRDLNHPVTPKHQLRRSQTLKATAAQMCEYLYTSLNLNPSLRLADLGVCSPKQWNSTVAIFSGSPSTLWSRVAFLSKGLTVRNCLNYSG